ncbi:MAG: hypothetical protein RMY34_25175 [Aulosira sp. DedQUE10]|nr:hypothetical protein [Aulosira sp. DedQUE10]
MQISTLIAAIASLIMTCCWSVLSIERKYMLYLSIALVTITTIFCLPFYLPVVFFYRPATLLPVSLFSMTILVVIKSESGKKIFSVIAYPLNAVLLLLAIELLKSPGTTWGNTAADLGIFNTINAIFILQLLTYFVLQNLFYGICKLLTGLISSLLIVILGFKTSMFTFGTEIFLRKVCVMVSIFMILEGIALIYKSKKLSN